MKLARTAWRHPEWWTLGVSTAAWVVIFVRGQATGTDDHSRHGDPSWLVANGLIDWLLMVAAMMVPLVIEGIRTTAARSFWQRRHRAIALFLGGYLTPWIGVGVVAVILVSLFPVAKRGAAAATVFIAAAIWELTAAKRRARLACHRTMPLAPCGWRADRDCFAYGYTTGRRCASSCWALMLGCALAHHAAPVMVAVGLVGAAERYAFRPRPRLAATAVLGIASLVFAQSVGVR